MNLYILDDQEDRRASKQKMYHKDGQNFGHKQMSSFQYNLCGQTSLLSPITSISKKDKA